MSGNLIRTVEIGLLLDPTKKQSLIRKRDHKKEQSDLLLDYLDYQSDLLVQQISLDIPTFTIILHKQMAFETNKTDNLQRQNDAKKHSKMNNYSEKEMKKCGMQDVQCKTGEGYFIRFCSNFEYRQSKSKTKTSGRSI